MAVLCFSLRLLVNILFFRLCLNNLNKAEGFVDISANRKIVDCDLPQSSRLVDHKQTSEAEMMLPMYFFAKKLHDKLFTSDPHPP